MQVMDPLHDSPYYRREGRMNIFTRKEKQRVKDSLPGIEQNLEDNVLDI